MLQLDSGVIILYFVLVFGIAGFVSFNEKAGSDSKNYFLGGSNLGWLAIGASLFADNIGPEHLIGLAGSGTGSFFP